MSGRRPRVLSWFQTKARPRAIALVTLIYLFFALAVMQPGAQKLEKLSGKPVEILDLQFGFTVEKAQAILSSYSSSALQAAATFLIWADTVYPLIYGLLLSMLLAYLYSKGRRQYVVLLPWLAVLVDFAENAGLYKVLTTFPNAAPGWIQYAAVCNAMKWILLGLTGLILVFGSLQRIVRYLLSVRKVAP